MSFISYTFLGFIALLLIVYYAWGRLFQGKGQWAILLVASYVFYACADVRYLIYISVTSLTAYLAARAISSRYARQKQYLSENKDIDKEEKKKYKAKIKTGAMWWMIVCLLFNFGILFVFKYLNFFIFNINSVLGLFSLSKLSAVRLLLPLGISFYTFQTMGYVIDVYYGKYEAERNPFRLALFTSFFPQLIQGPIGRYNHLSQTLYSYHKWDTNTVMFGLQRALWGFFKKLVIADRMLPAVRTLISSPDEYSGIWVIVGMVFYAAQLYSDFTGGIDITIGVAEMFGVRMSENFIRPFFSKNVAEYWRRWHISMGTWFKDYTFYPLSTSKTMMKFTKFCKDKFGPKIAKRAPVYLATIILWFVTGAWHGASWNFIFWGLGNCFVILVSQELSPLYRRFHEKYPKIGTTVGYKIFQILRTNAIMCCLRAFDCYSSVGETFKQVTSIVTNWNFTSLFQGTLLKLGLSGADYAVLIVGVLVMFAVSMAGRKGSVREQIARRPFPVQLALYGTLFIVTIVFGAYGVGYDAGGFIYTVF